MQDQQAGSISRRSMLLRAAGVGAMAALSTIALDTPAFAYSIQAGWRYCGKCAGMIWPINNHICPAGGAHSLQGWTFQLPYNGYNLQNQPNWRCCMNCNALYFAGYDPSGWGNDGQCPATGNVHQHTGQDVNFNLPFNVGEPAWHQHRWRFCAKTPNGCFMLFFDGYDGQDGRPWFKGVCPSGANGHVAAGYDFAIPVYSYQT